MKGNLFFWLILCWFLSCCMINFSCDMRRQLQQSLPRYADNMDYLATTECHKIVYPSEKQKLTSSDGYQKNCWLSISSTPLQVSFWVVFDCCLPIVIKCNPSDHLVIGSRLHNLVQMRKNWATGHCCFFVCNRCTWAMATEHL